ncbi:MAG: hypothetical protein Q8M24_23485 [Pseudolabrys sp.]|nr:hypothetical protein [Pseudolabrys sp.]
MPRVRKMDFAEPPCQAEAEIIAKIRKLPREAQWRIRDEIPKRPRGRPRGNRIFPIKDEALKMYEALPATMNELEKLRAVQAKFPELSWGPLVTLIHGNDWRFRATKNRDYS